MMQQTGDRGARGGARHGSGRKPWPTFKPGEVVIDVRDCAAYVSIWRRNDSAFWLEAAQNADQLEDAATSEVEQLGGYITLSGIYPCSAELAQTATFNRRTE